MNQEMFFGFLSLDKLLIYFYIFGLFITVILLYCYFSALKPKKGTLEWVGEETAQRKTFAGSYCLKVSDYIVSLALIIIFAAAKILFDSLIITLPPYPASISFNSALESILRYISAQSFILLPGSLSLPAWVGYLAFGGIIGVIYILFKNFSGRRALSLFVSLFGAVIISLASGVSSYASGEAYLYAYFDYFTALFSLFLMLLAFSLPYETKRWKMLLIYLFSFVILGFNQYIYHDIPFNYTAILLIIFHIWDISFYYKKDRRPGGLWAYGIFLFISCLGVCFVLPGALVIFVQEGQYIHSLFPFIKDGFSLESLFYSTVSCAVPFQILLPFGDLTFIAGAVIGAYQLSKKKNSVYGTMFLCALSALIIRSGLITAIARPNFCCLLALSAFIFGDMIKTVLGRGSAGAKAAFIIFLTLFSAGSIFMSLYCSGIIFPHF